MLVADVRCGSYRSWSTTRDSHSVAGGTSYIAPRDITLLGGELVAE